MTKFSVLIPTRLRHDTLKYTIETVVNQTFDDYEIVVSNNCNDKSTTDVVNSFNNPRIREVASNELLSMSANWEFGLKACVGEYVTVLGDDDGLVPEALEYANYTLSGTGAKVMSWPYHDYFWPAAPSEVSRSHLVVRYAKEEIIITGASIQKLKEMYNFNTQYCTYPMIYNGFVHRDIISAAQKQNGMYFACEVPDIFSALVNLNFSESFVYISRPLAVRGSSHHSNGGASSSDRKKSETAMQRFHKEAGIEGKGVHPMLFQSPTLAMAIAGSLLVASDLMFSDNPDLNVDFRRVINIMTESARNSYDQYDLTVEHLVRLAEMHGIPRSDYVIPPKPPSPGIRIATGPFYKSDGSLDCVIINGAQCNLQTIADAVRLVTAMTPLPIV